MREAIVSEEERAQIVSVYNTLVNPQTAIVELKLAKQQLHSMLQKMNGSCWYIAEHGVGATQVLQAISNEKDVKRLIELIRTIGVMYYYFSAPPDFVVSAKEMILVNLVHEHGHVRDTARRIISNWRLHDNYVFDKQIHNETIDFIKKLVSLIKKYSPKNTTIPLDTMAPSVYKTLLLAYEEIVCGQTIETFIVQHPELQIDISYEEFIPVTDRSSQLPLLWNKHPCIPETQNQANKLVEQAYIRMQYFLEQAPFTAAEITHVRSKLAVASSQREQEQVVEYLVFNGIKKQINPLLLGPIIREVQSIINHTFRTEKNIPFNYALLSARTMWTEEKRSGTKNWNEWVEYLCATHTQIDNFYREHFAKHQKIWTDIEERFASLPANDYQFEVQDHLATYKKSLIDCCSIAHHILDWILQSYPSFTSKTPDKLAAICYGVVIQINQGGTPYSNNELAVFCGLKSASSILESSRTVDRMLFDVVSDPTLMHTLNRLSDTKEEDGEIELHSPLGEVAINFIRFYVVLTSHSHMSSIEHARVQKSCDIEAASGSCVVEEILPYDNYVVLVLGIYFNIPPQSVIDTIIISANAMDPFLRFHFFITNTHVPSQEEIDSYTKSFSK